MTRLYCGIEIDGVWYNQARIEELEGSRLALLDTNDKRGSGKALHILKKMVKVVATPEGEEYELNEFDYLNFAFIDTIGICLAVMERFDDSTFTERFYCDQCSSLELSKYTEVTKSWRELIEAGEISEIFLNGPEELQEEIVLEKPIVIDESREINAGEYDTIIRSPVTIGDMLKLDSSQLQNEARITWAWIDASIKEIKGMPARELQILKRSPKGFSERLITDDEDLARLSEEYEAGLLAYNRAVLCRHCNADIGGYLDFTNFFSPFSVTKSRRNTRRRLGA